jgi:hypothetical protein
MSGFSRPASGTLTIRAFDSANALLEATTYANVGDLSASGYIGIVLPADETLGRVNVSAGTNDVSGADNIRVFGASVPEPASLTIAVLAVLSLSCSCLNRWKGTTHAESQRSKRGFL